MLLSSLCLFFLPIASAAAGSNALKCLPSGDERQINEAFLKGRSVPDPQYHKLILAGGKGTTVTLCKNSVHRLRNPVVFTAARQTLTTEGNPTGRERALLIVEGEEQSAAIQSAAALTESEDGTERQGRLQAMQRRDCPVARGQWQPAAHAANTVRRSYVADGQLGGSGRARL